MTKDKAIYAWFNSFGIPFYPVSSVPDDSVFPWGTYELALGAWDSGEVSMTVNLWYHTESEVIPTLKALEISDRIGMGGVMLPCDGGAIWIKRGSPWCRNLHDPKDKYIKRRYINITAEFLTMN